MRPQLSLVYISCPPEAAETLAGTLVESRLAACINLLPVRSVYRWQERLQQDDEVLLLVKTRSDRLPLLRERVLAQHPYSLPEIIAVALDDGHPAYLDWLADETRE